MHIAIVHQLLTDARAPFLNPDWPPFRVFAPINLLGMTVPWCGISLWSFWIICPSCAPSQFLLRAFSLAERKEEKNPLLKINMTSQKSKTSVYYQHHSYSEHSTVTAAEKKLTHSSCNQDTCF